MCIVVYLYRLPAHLDVCKHGIFEVAVRCRCCSVVLKLVKMWMFIKKSDEELILKLMKKYILISLHPLLACRNIRNPSLNVIFDSFFTSSISSALDGWAALLRKPLQFTPDEDCQPPSTNETSSEDNMVDMYIFNPLQEVSLEKYANLK